MPNAAKNPPDHEEVGVGGEGDEEEPGKEERADQPTNLKWKVVKNSFGQPPNLFPAKQLAQHPTQETHWNRGKYIETRWKDLFMKRYVY